MHADDSVCVAVRDLNAGDTVTVAGRSIELAESVPFGHKVAVSAVGKGESVYKYGQPIGLATRQIQPGDWVHSHNLAMDESDRQYEYATETPPPPKPLEGHTFMGYRRPDGRAGTRNYIAIVSTVNCSASVARMTAQQFDAKALADYPNIDGVIALAHKGGCSMACDGENHLQLARVMAGFARHPNVGACVLVGLGCETASPGHLVETGCLASIGIGQTSPPVLIMQEQGGTARTIDTAVRTIRDLLPKVNDVQRQPIDAGELILGTECGGSDGSSGITANPALGAAADMLVAAGGTVILSEVPEIFGAEHLMTRRAISEEVGRKLIERIEWWKQYTRAFGLSIDDNRSTGNKEGGLTTIYEKSLGAISKGGSMALSNVYRYAEPVTDKGLVIMDSPGYDPDSVTGLVASGANVVCFTTGRGSCFGCKPTPSIKIASNTPMYERMIDDMDVDAGTIYADQTVQQVGGRIFQMILDVASGKPTKSESLGLGEEEFSPWSIGPTA